MDVAEVGVVPAFLLASHTSPIESRTRPVPRWSTRGNVPAANPTKIAPDVFSDERSDVVLGVVAVFAEYYGCSWS